MADAKPLTIIHTESSCGWGGQEIRTLTEARGMLARGHDVTLLCPAEAPLHAAAVKAGLPVVVLPIARKNLRALRALRGYLRARRRIDVINTHSSTDSWLVALARLLLARPAPVVRTRHVSTTINNRVGTRWLYQAATRHIVTTGEALKRQLAQKNSFDPARMTSVPTGIDLARYQPRDARAGRASLGLDATRRYLGIVATLRNWKGHTYLLDAFVSLASAHPDWDLLIVGDGPQRNNLEQRVAALNLSDRVRFVGNRDDAERWFNAFDAFVLPSYGEEGISQSVMQAMASGLPVITTTVGALTEAVQHEVTGLLVPPRDTASLRTALERVMTDADLRARLGDAALRFAQAHFGSERMLDRMEAVFRRVTAGSR